MTPETVDPAALLPTLPTDPTQATPGASGLADLKRRVAAAVVAARGEILDLSHQIHATPEPAFEEVRASMWVAAAIARHGYAVEHPAGSLATAVRGRLTGGLGGGKPRIGILAEYDALPGLGHGCGHNTMAGSGVGAAIALAAVAPDLRGEVVFLGTPAEERGSGKGVMIADGLFADLDAALLYHPSDDTHVEARLLASEDVYVTFEGLQAHAAAEPWMGRNALDAMILLFSSVGLWRQQLRPDARIHGIIQDGGTAANIIPSRTRAWFIVRSPRDDEYLEMRARFIEMCHAAAAATGCKAEVTFEGGAWTMRHNRTLGGLFVANLAAHGVVNQPPSNNLGSSDMGNVSQVTPSIHPHVAICDAGVPFHSIAFREAAISARADETTLLVATVVAETALDLFADADLVEAAWREFRGD